MSLPTSPPPISELHGQAHQEHPSPYRPPRHRRYLPQTALLLLLAVAAAASGQEPPSTGLPSNDISYLAAQGEIIWAGSSAGLSRSLGGGDTSDDWRTFGPAQGLAGMSVSSLYVTGDTIIAGATDESGNGGAGLNFSPDGGDTWATFKPDSIIGLGRVVWGVTVRGPDIWAAIWNGIPDLHHNLAHSADGGLTWQYHRPTDDFKRPLAFAVLLDNAYLWCGTGTGVHRTPDNGSTWEKFDFASGDLPGDWVVRLERQTGAAGPVALWAACRSLGEGQKPGLARYSYASSSWETADTIHQVWDLAFADGVIWAAADEGVLRSEDDGATWETFGRAEGLASNSAAALEVIGDTVWVASEDGLSRSIDAGATWSVIRRSPATHPAGTPATYAYPNPFSPLRDQLVKIRYSLAANDRVTVVIYNFAHEKIRSLVENKESAEGGEEVELWDGRDDGGRIVANGVYFYSVRTEKGNSSWGKIAVLD